MSIRLVVVDDHPILRHGMRSLLADSHLIEVVGEAETGEEALAMVGELQPDILLVDIDMPDISGIEVVKRLHSQDNPVNVLVLSAYDDVNYVHELLQYEIAGYLLKDEAAKMLVQAVESVAYGEKGWFSPQIKQRLSQIAQKRHNEHILSPREVEVLRLTAQGKTNRAIAVALQISEKTVEKHLDSIYRKLDVRSRTEAAVVALQGSLL